MFRTILTAASAARLPRAAMLCAAVVASKCVKTGKKAAPPPF